MGVGLCVDGHVLRGKNGNAGHAGHSFVSDDDNQALCGCGSFGDVEGLVADNAIARRFGEPAVDLFAAAATAKPKALATTDALCRVMGRMLFNLVATLDLQRISLGGSVFGTTATSCCRGCRPRSTASSRPSPGAAVLRGRPGDRRHRWAMALLDWSEIRQIPARAACKIAQSQRAQGGKHGCTAAA